jgi:hypothetical protein
MCEPLITGDKWPRWRGVPCLPYGRRAFCRTEGRAGRRRRRPKPARDEQAVPVHIRGMLIPLSGQIYLYTCQMRGCCVLGEEPVSYLAVLFAG